VGAEPGAMFKPCPDKRYICADKARRELVVCTDKVTRLRFRRSQERGTSSFECEHDDCALCPGEPGEREEQK
jgi:hypothetical protein